jgi:hypothetical protein
MKEAQQTQTRRHGFVSTTNKRVCPASTSSALKKQALLPLHRIKMDTDLIKPINTLQDTFSNLGSFTVTGFSVTNEN